MLHRPKLKDKLYGEMFWEEWDEGEAYWYTPIKDESGERFELLIRADSQADFLSVAATHSAYKKLLGNINSIRDRTVGEIMENSTRLFKKKRQRRFIGEEIKKHLKLFSIKIYPDLSAMIEFTGNVSEVEDPEEIFYALVDDEGDFIEAGIKEL
jgi:hypothetical protein